MRIALITFQAVALSLFAVLGAQGDPNEAPKCPIGASSVADRDCTY